MRSPSGENPAHSDVDGDGNRDALIGNVVFPFMKNDRLYLNDGFGFFTDVTATHLPATPPGGEAR